MEYEPEFAKSFMRRTLEVAQSYDGPYDATLLVNCLLGLLIVPKESLVDKIPDTPFESLAEWGINPLSVKRFGRCDQGHEHKPNLRQLVRRFRNAVAHFRLDPVHRNGEVTGYRFSDRSGFRAELSLAEMNDFVAKLSAYLEENA